MKYKIERAAGEGQPCEEAYQQVDIDDWFVDIDSFDDLERFVRKYGNVRLKLDEDWEVVLEICGGCGD